ncbi:MAG: procyclic acidic repetitive family protein [Candidatus Cloacimonetes bacterium]|nr:procyclic acidic repetitive family protein [Candidatus Cloacimonadota bacterium]
MKKYSLLFLLFLFSFSMAYSQANRLENYQIASFNGVTRVSLTFTRRPITNVMKESNDLRVTIGALQCELGNVPSRFTTPDMFASIMVISSPTRDLSIEIETTQTYEQVRQFGTLGRQYTMHLDIIKTENPERIEDILSLLDYYHFIGNRESLNELLESAQISYPDHPQLLNRVQNQFNQPTIYSPRPTSTTIAQPITTTRPRQEVQTQTFDGRTTTPQPPRQTQQNDLPTTITNTPEVIQPPPPPPPPPPIQQPEPQLPPELPQTTNNRAVELNDISFTLITRHDRFPTRIPQTKPIFLETEPEQIPIYEPPQQPEIVHQPISEPISQPEPEPIRQPEPEPIRQPENNPNQQVEQVQIVYRDITDPSGMSEIEQMIVRYYHVASVDSILVSFLVGASANIVGDYQNAIHFLSQVPPTDINYENALRLLQDSYLSIGDTVNANFYSSMLLTEEEPAPETGFINTPVALWMVGVLGGLALIVGFVIAAISMGAKKEQKLQKAYREQSIPEEDYSRHVTNIQKAYDNKPAITPSQSFEEIEKTESLSAHYDDPPILTEELTPQETIELKSEEKTTMNFGNNREIEAPIETKRKFAEEDDYEAFGDDEYRKNLVLKLYKDGWKLEEIAKEVQISQREIDLIVKLSG